MTPTSVETTQRLWDDVWVPNERDFDANFAPRERADVLYPTD